MKILTTKKEEYKIMLKEIIMKAYINIENSHTREVKIIELSIIEFIENKIIKFDIHSLNEEENKILVDAISELPELEFTDIEMFFIDEEQEPNFGPDYDFYIKDNTLVGIYNREIYPRGN